MKTIIACISNIYPIDNYSEVIYLTSLTLVKTAMSIDRRFQANEQYM